jgi:Fic family protein
VVRKTDVRRDSVPHPAAPAVDEETKAKLEARNGLLQIDEVMNLIAEAERSRKFKLKPSTLQRLHRLAVKDIYPCAGTYRTRPVSIAGTEHQPPAAEHVPELVEGMCEYVNDSWATASPVHLSAYIMWRLNWIHPFAGGNGRTSRAVSYLVLCAKLGHKVGGTLTIPEQIVANRQPYYAALDAADAADLEGRVDVSVMEQLLSGMFAKQLLTVHAAATSPPFDQ